MSIDRLLNPQTESDWRRLYGVAPVLDGKPRAEITDILSNALANQVLQRRNAYTYWAHEVEFQRPLVRVDFVSFEPFFSHMRTDAVSVEKGVFSFYEVKSCMGDLKSGHGLNFDGDVNYLVMPVELYPKYKDALIDHVIKHDGFCKYLLYGSKRGGSLGFKEIGEIPQHCSRNRPAAEILLCMMRAMIANSGHSCVEHSVSRFDSDGKLISAGRNSDIENDDCAAASNGVYALEAANHDFVKAENK